MKENNSCKCFIDDSYNHRWEKLPTPCHHCHAAKAGGAGNTGQAIIK